jgi:hypothetical protein
MTDLIKPAGIFGDLWLPRNVAGLLYNNGWAGAIPNVEMNATIFAESGRYEAAVGDVNPDGSQDWGMFQLNNRHFTYFGYKTQELFYEACIVAPIAVVHARTLFEADRKAGGTGFGPWFGHGSAQFTKGLPSSCGGLANFCAQHFGLKSVV